MRRLGALAFVIGGNIHPSDDVVVPEEQLSTRFEMVVIGRVAGVDDAELVSLGLFDEVPTTEFPAGKDFIYGVRVSSLGKETQKFLFALISEFINETGQAQESPAP